MCDFGAEVIKVEAPGAGDPMRTWGAAKYRDRSLWWPVQSRGKKLVTLDLRSERGQDLCRQLAGGCDALIENFRPGTMERWNLGPEEMLERHPGLVYARVSGYGQTGPYAGRAGFASAGESIGGLRHLNGFPDDPPPRVGVSLGDSLSGMFTALGVMLALYHRDARGGDGQVVDASIMESCFAMLESIPAEFQKLGLVRGPSGTGLANNAPSNLYASRDRKWIVISANSDNLFERLAAAMGRDDLAQDERFATHDGRGAYSELLDRIIGDWARELDSHEISERLNAAGVVCAPVYSIADIFEDPQYAAREVLTPVHDPELGEVLGPAITPKLSATPGRVRFESSWDLGCDNDSVYGELLGLDRGQLSDLEREGTI